MKREVIHELTGAFEAHAQQQTEDDVELGFNTRGTSDLILALYQI